MPLYPFTREYILNSPVWHGVYYLYDFREIVYIGRALGAGVSIRSRLLNHKSGSNSKDRINANYYAFEITSFPARRESELLQWFQRHYGRLPKYNQVLPRLPLIRANARPRSVW